MQNWWCFNVNHSKSISHIQWWDKTETRIWNTQLTHAVSQYILKIHFPHILYNWSTFCCKNALTWFSFNSQFNTIVSQNSVIPSRFIAGLNAFSTLYHLHHKYVATVTKCSIWVHLTFFERKTTSGSSNNNTYLLASFQDNLDKLAPEKLNQSGL